jgi:hypothetical protein
MTMSLTWAIVARSSVPSVGHPTLKIAHSTYKRFRALLGGGAHIGSRDPRRLQRQGVGTCNPTGISGLISLGPPEMLREECQTSENKTQTEVVGGKEDLLH